MDKSSGAHSVLSRDQMTDFKIDLEQPLVPLSGESRYLPRLWVSRNEESQDGLCQSDPSQSITTDFDPKAEALFLGRQRIKEKIRAALKLLTFREQHVLVQFWSPCDVGKHQQLTTSDQPFGFGVPSEELCFYRRESEQNAFFVDKHDEEEVASPPARVFKQGLPEWTSDVTSYNPKDFPQQVCAIRCNLHGYLALPVFDCTTGLCAGVIEVLMRSKYMTYDYEVKQIHGALKTQNLACPQVFNGPAWSVPRQIEMDKILGALKNVCGIHSLPLAQTWAVSRVTSSVSHDDNPFETSCSSFDTKCIGRVCMSTAGLPFHVQDLSVWNFMKACKEQHLDKFHSFVGKALSSRASCFCRDVTKLNEEEYPLVHYASMYKLTGCFTIFLHSVEGDDDYVLEFFLPFGMEDINYVRHLVQTLEQKFDVHSGFELGDTSPMDLSVLSHSESTLTNISDQGSSTNLSTEKRRAASTFTDDEETSSPLKKLRIDSVPVPSVTVEVTCEEDVTSFHFPNSPGLFKVIKNKVAQWFKLEVNEFTLKYLDDEYDWISILSDADLDFATSDSDSISLSVQ